MSWPVRWYWSHSKRQVGKKAVVDLLIKPMLPAQPAGFEAELPGGGRVFLHHRSDIGLVVSLSGGFETAEIDRACRLAKPGSVAIDVGANVGMFTVALALAVGPRGRVLAVEPARDNVDLLKQNLELNRLQNVAVHELAIAAESGQVALQIGADPAFHSTTTVVKAREGERSVMVQAETLDSVWIDAGSPDVSFLKIDTEGGELGVIRSATRLLKTCRPPVLLEAKSHQRLRELDEIFSPLGYSHAREPGFACGNYLFSVQ
jgi:FkbM family methyltransferase